MKKDENNRRYTIRVHPKLFDKVKLYAFRNKVNTAEAFRILITLAVKGMK